MTNHYGNKVIEIRGCSPLIVEIAAGLMPPQYDEFCKAMRGECTDATNA